MVLPCHSGEAKRAIPSLSWLASTGSGGLRVVVLRLWLWLDARVDLGLG